MTRFHPKNVNVQDSRCNLFESGNTYEYGLALNKKYGEGTADYLIKIAKQNKYQDEVLTFTRLIQALENKEDYESVYNQTMKKYEKNSKTLE